MVDVDLDRAWTPCSMPSRSVDVQHTSVWRMHTVGAPALKYLSPMNQVPSGGRVANGERDVPRIPWEVGEISGIRPNGAIWQSCFTGPR